MNKRNVGLITFWKHEYKENYSNNPNGPSLNEFLVQKAIEYGKYVHLHSDDEGKRCYRK
jgi:hypothetical protein